MRFKAGHARYEKEKKGRREEGRIKPVEELKTIELISGNAKKTIRIGSQMILKMEVLAVDFLKRM